MKRRTITITCAALLLFAVGCGSKMTVDNTPTETIGIDVVETEEMAAEEVSFDAANVPEEVNAEFVLMDAFNELMIERNCEYSSDDSVCVWNSVMYAVGISDMEANGITIPEGEPYFAVPADYVKNLIGGMYSGMTDVPEIPDELKDTTGEGYDTVIKHDDNTYYLAAGDRGCSKSSIVEGKKLADGSYEVTVRLDATDGEITEICAFTYTLVKNESESQSLFPYAISGVRPGDELTEKKLAGEPYFNKTVYYGEQDETIHEELNFASIQYNDAMYDLNRRISEDIYNVTQCVYQDASQDEVAWEEVKSYPFDGDKYMQIVTTAIVYPNYGTDGYVFSYNYDKVNKKAIKLEDAYTLAGTTEDDVVAGIKAHESEMISDGESIEGVDIKGFRIKPDDTIEYYAIVSFKSTEAEDYDGIFIYDSAKDSITSYDSDVLIENNTDDMVDLNLTHGVK